MKKSLFSLLIALLPFAVCAAEPGPPAEAPVFSTAAGAIDGYDPVAYFTQSKPVRGARDITLEWQGARWHFANVEHREMFRAEPERYAPQFGGYCAYAVAHDYTAKIDPEAWAIEKGRLYLNYNAKVAGLWQAQKADFIPRAQTHWPRLRGTPKD